MIEDLEYDDYCGIIGILSGYNCQTCVNCNDCISKQNKWLENQFVKEV